MFTNKFEVLEQHYTQEHGIQHCQSIQGFTSSLQKGLKKERHLQT